MPLESRHSDPANALFRLMFLLALVGLSCQLNLPPAGIPPPPTDNKPDSSAWYSVYFSDPTDPKSQNLRGGPDRSLAESIRSARASVDVAVTIFNLWSLRDALIDAHRRGVTVRVVVESDYIDEAEIQELIKTGIPVLGDRREGFMHNKFVVIDRLEVWSGSMNFTVNGAYRNDNNLVRVRSTRLAENYTAEFEEMFVDDSFGPGSPADTPHPRFELNGTLFAVYFSPEDGTLAHLLALVQSANESILFMVYAFTSDDLAVAMIERAQTGVRVAGVLEASQARSNVGGEYEHLRASGVDVRLDGNRSQMHHKVMIIDSHIVVTGSYNFSYNAETRNDENTLVINNAELAALYNAEFERVFSEASK